MAKSERERIWERIALDQFPVFALGLDMALALRLCSLGFRTVGSIDAVIQQYREKDFFRLVGARDGRLVVRNLLSYCQRRFREELEVERGVRGREFEN